MFKRVLSVLLVAVLLVAPCLGAGIPFEETYSSSFYNMATVTNIQTSVGWEVNLRGMLLNPGCAVPEFTSMFTQIPASLVTNYNSLSMSDEATVDICYSDQSGTNKGLWSTGTVGYFKFTAGGKEYLQYWVDIDSAQHASTNYFRFFLQPGETFTFPRLLTNSGPANTNTATSMVNAMTTDTSGVIGSFAGDDQRYSKNYMHSMINSLKCYPILSGQWRNTLSVSLAGSGDTERAIININKIHSGYSGISDHVVAFGETDYTVLGGSDDVEYSVMANQWPFDVSIHDVYTHVWHNQTFGAGTLQPCTINVYDADTRLPLAGSWDYYVVIQGADAVNGSASGAFTVVNLPVTSILKPHLLYVTKEGYEMTPGFVAIDVPAGGREIKIYLTPLETTAPDNSSVVTFSVTDIESGAPVHSALVNVDGVAKYVGASGTAWFILPENTSHDWVVSSPNHWPIGGNFTVGVDDQTIAVSLTRRTSDLPRPPLPELPNFPVIHPSLDPAGFRMQILSVPLLGSLASPLLDTVDSLGVGLNGMATAVLDVLTAPADYITGAVSSVGQNLIDTATPYLVTSSLLLQVIGAVISCIPEQVCGLVTFGLLLDIVRILLWGPA